MNDKADLLISALGWLMTFGLIAGIIAGALHWYILNVSTLDGYKDVTAMW